MRIVVPVKHVPDIHSVRTFTPEGRITRSAEDGTLNELDENAIETALQIIEALGADQREAHEVIALTVGPEVADGAIRKAFQLGVDTGIRVSDPALVGSDVFGTATAITAAIRRIEQDGAVDLVITGMAALDGLGSVIPALLAAQLQLPQVTLATKLTVDNGVIEATRELDGVTEVIAASLPAVLSVTDHINTPRYPNFKLIMAARTKDITAWDLTDLGIDAHVVGDAGARTHVTKSVERPPRQLTELVTDKGQGGLALAQYLIDNDLV